MQNLANHIKLFNEYVGRLVAWLCIPLVVGTFLIALLRYSFSISWIWLQELTVWAHALLFMLASAYTLAHDEHVRVDIFYRRFSPRCKSWINLLGCVFFLAPVSILLISVSFDYVVVSWTIQEGSRDAGGLPYPFVPLLKTAIPLAFALVFIQGVTMVLMSIEDLYRGGTEVNKQTEECGNPDLNGFL